MFTLTGSHVQVGIGRGDMTSIVSLRLLCSGAAPALKPVTLLVLEVTCTFIKSKVRF